MSVENPEKNNSRLAAATLTELIVTMAVSSILAAALLTGAAYARKSFQASEYYVSSQTQQLRLLDYMALDLRRALTVNATATTLSLTIPDYYDAAGKPRMPTVARGEATYGDATDPVPVRYYKQGNSIYREIDGDASAIATDAATLVFTPVDNGQVVEVKVTFTPKYRWSGAPASLRPPTEARSRTLLRNQRRN